MIASSGNSITKAILVPIEPIPEDNRTVSELLRAMRAAFVALYEIAAQTAVIGTLLAATFVWLTLWWSPLMTASAIIMVVLLALAIFATRGNFGEALLSLAGGLFMVFAYEWTPERYIAYAVAWVGFAVFSGLIASFKFATGIEKLAKLTAIRVAGPMATTNQVRNAQETILQLMRPNSTSAVLDAIERMKIMRTFAFRDLPLSQFPAGVRTAESLATIMDCDFQRLARFVADFLIAEAPADDNEATIVLVRLYRQIQTTPVPPEEFLTAFENSRRLVVSGVVQPTRFLELLCDCLTRGVGVDDICEEIRKTSGRGASRY